MANWKKLLVSGSNISELNNDAGYLASLNGTGVYSSSAQIDLNGDIKGTADANYIGSDVIVNSMISPTAAISYTKIDFTGSGIVTGSVDLSAYVTTSSFNTFTASYATDSASLSTRVTDLESFSSSLDATFVSEAEFGTFTASYYVDSASFSASISTVATDLFTLATETTNVSGAFSTRITTLEDSASAADAFSASFSTRLTNDEAKYDAYTSSFTTSTLIVTSAASVTGSFGVQGDASFAQNVVVEGNLTVNGTASFVNVEELSIKDKFITLASGSNSLTDSGIIFQSSTSGVGSGPSLFLEATSTGTYGRMAMATSVDVNATAATPAAYVNTTEVGDIALMPTDPTFGGSTNGFGNMYIDPATGDVYIYS